jgi:nucleoside-diphosphate-sugar epimerase
MAKNILVTGATGFIGKHLVMALIEKNHNVKIFARNEEKARKMFGDKVEYIIGNISEEEKIKNSLIGIDLVYHFASIRGENKLLNKENYFKNNILPTKLFCEYCLIENIKLVYLSSSGVNGWPKKLPVDETYPYSGKGLYHWSKIESEKEILNFVKKGLNAVIVRTVMVYGTGDNGFLFIFIDLIRRRRFVVIGSGENRIHLLDVNSLVQGLLKIIDIFKSGEIYYMADESPITINELIKTISDKFKIKIPFIKLPLFLFKIVAFFFDFLSSILKIKFPITTASVDILTKDRYYSAEKAKRELGFVGGNVKHYIDSLRVEK